jgi:hypothetical protein
MRRFYQSKELASQISACDRAPVSRYLKLDCPTARVMLINRAGVAQLVERDVPNVNVEGSNPFARSLPHSGGCAVAVGNDRRAGVDIDQRAVLAKILATSLQGQSLGFQILKPSEHTFGRIIDQRDADDAAKRQSCAKPCKMTVPNKSLTALGEVACGHQFLFFPETTSARFSASTSTMPPTRLPATVNVPGAQLRAMVRLILPKPAERRTRIRHPVSAVNGPLLHRKRGFLDRFW